MSFLSSGDKVKQLKQDKAYNLAFLQEQYQIGPAQIDALYSFAKFQFECGNYSGAAEFLYHYRCAAGANGLDTLCTLHAAGRWHVLACMRTPHFVVHPMVSSIQQCTSALY